MGELHYQGHRISYDEYGEGDRVLVLVHGLLMNRHMFERVAPALADHGHRVICVDLLGHGGSDQPEDLRLYSMPLFARQLSALLDHLEVSSAVVGGTSLGANVALELAVHEPERVKGLFIEMPVLDNALAAVAAFFAPILLGLRIGRPGFEAVARVASIIPRTTFLVDIGLDFVRRRPGPSVAVLEGLLLGETAPHREERRQIDQPALVVGHPRDPLHPFSDSGMLVEELPNAQLVEANSILEWRLNPKRLTEELALFLEGVWAGAPTRRRKRSTSSNGRRSQAAAKG
ncbi:MAG: alpha/beta hydrolase [Solirubrobacterales bacterium]